MSTPRLTYWSLNLLTYAVVGVLIAPVVWLVLGSLQTSGQLANGTYDFLHPTIASYREMWDTIDFERYFVNSLVICSSAALLATAFASSAGYALARFRFRGADAFSLTVIGTQLIPGSMFLLPIFLGFIWLNQNTPVQLYD